MEPRAPPPRPPRGGDSSQLLRKQVTERNFQSGGLQGQTGNGVAKPVKVGGESHTVPLEKTSSVTHDTQEEGEKVLPRSTMRSIVRGNSVLDNLKFMNPAHRKAPPPIPSKSNAPTELMSMKELLDRLLNPSLQYGEEFIRNFLLTYHYLVQPHVLLADLFTLYFTGEQSKADIHTTRGRVVQIVKTWLEVSPEDFIGDVKMILLLSNWYGLMNGSFETPGEDSWAREFKTIWNTPKTKPSEIPQVQRNMSPKEQKNVQKYKKGEIFEKVSERYLACQLSLLDFELFQEVPARELLKKNWYSNENSSLIRVRDNFNRMVQWIATEVIKHKNPRQRAHSLSKFIRIGECLLSLNNLNGVMKIYKALTLPSVARLHKTWKYLTPEERTIWQSMDTVMNPDVGHSVYKNLVKTATGCLVPCFYILLEDIEELESSSLQRADGVIDFKRMGELASLLHSYKQFQRKAYGISPDYKVQKFFKEDLEIESLHKLSEASLKHEPPPEPSNTLEHQKWFFGGLDRAGAEEILRECKYSAFLLRNASEDGFYAVSYWNYQKNRVAHTRIMPCDEHTSKGFFIQGSKGTYDNLINLVENAPELYEFTAAWNDIAKEAKKKFNLPLPPDEADSALHNRMLRVKTFTTSQNSTMSARFFADNKTNQELMKPLQNSIQVANVQKLQQANIALDSRDIGTIIGLIQSGLPLASIFKGNQTILHVAADFNNPKLIDFVFEEEQVKPDVNKKDCHGWTPLHVACRGGYLEVIKALLLQGARVNELNNNGATPLHYLVRSIPEDAEMYTDTLKLIIHEHKAAINSQDINLQAPLHQACSAANLLAVKILVDSGANYHLEDKNAQTSEAIASYYGAHEIVQYIQQNGKKSAPSLGAIANTAAAKFQSDIILCNDQFVVDAGNKNVSFETELKNMSLQVGIGTPYSTFFAKKEHWNLIGKDTVHGVIIVSINHTPSTCQMLIRQRDGDYLFKIPCISDPTALQGAIKLFNPFEYKLMPPDEFEDVLTDMDLKMKTTNFTFGILHVPKGCYTEDMIFKEGEKTASLNDFISFLGRKVPLRGATSGFENLLPVVNEKVFDGDFSIYTEFQENLKILFHVSSSLSQESRRDHIYGQSVVIVFLDECSCFDLSVFYNRDTNVLFVVQWVASEKDQGCYRLAVCWRTGIHSFGPMLHFPPMFPKSADFKEFLLTKLVNASQVATNVAQKAKTFQRREDELGAIYHLQRQSRGRKPDKAEYSGKDLWKRGKEIGRGATGTVYQCTHRKTKELQCMKVIQIKDLEDELLLKQVKAERDLLRKLRHANTIRLIADFQNNVEIVMVLELCAGGSLEDDVTKDKPYTEAQAAPVLYQILDAVNYIHQNGISHRDLKPDNILFLDKTRKHVRIADFGFGKDLVSGTLGHTMAGTIDYVAPEIIMGEEYDYFGIDVWSCGCIAYFLLFGRPPFADHNAKMVEMVNAIRDGAYSLEYGGIHISDGAKTFIRRLMCVNPNQRATAAEALEDAWLIQTLNSATYA